MKIPVTHEEREAFYADLITRCFGSRKDRRSLYALLKNYYLYGQGNIQVCCDYNKLFPHIDLLSSFLFSGETTSFAIELSEDSSIQDSSLEQRKAQKVVPKINQNWHDWNIDVLFNEALCWSLVYSTMLVKFVPLGNGVLGVYLVEPQNFGVLREDVPLLDNQEAMAHEYLMSESEFERRINGMGEEEQKRLRDAVASSFTEVMTGGDTVPMPVAKLIVTSTSPNIQGQVANVGAQYDFSPKIQEKCCRAQEVIVWDDDKNDYRMATMIENQYLLFDQGGNSFIEQEHPFVKITPNMMTTYFWGRPEIMFLIPLQEWMNTRVGEIKKMLARLADPPMAGIGLEGIVEEKFEAFGRPGSRIATAMPSGSVSPVLPNSPADIFKELEMIEMMFNEVSGIRELMQGKGAPGVRATSHADLLVRVGSSRVKKKAAILEDAIEKIGTLVLSFMKKYDNTYYQIDEPKMKFIAKELSPKAAVKVDSHSSSPIFMDQQLQKIENAFKAGAVDKEDLIDAYKFQNSAYMKEKLKKREAENNKLAAIGNLVEQADGENDTTIWEKIKMLFKNKKSG